MSSRIYSATSGCHFNIIVTEIIIQPSSVLSIHLWKIKLGECNVDVPPFNENAFSATFTTSHLITIISTSRLDSLLLQPSLPCFGLLSFTSSSNLNWTVRFVMIWNTFIKIMNDLVTFSEVSQLSIEQSQTV